MYVCVCVQYVYVCFHIYLYIEIGTERKKIGKTITVTEFGEGYIHCIIFQLFWRISIIQNKKVGENKFQKQSILNVHI